MRGGGGVEGGRGEGMRVRVTSWQGGSWQTVELLMLCSSI